MAKQYTIKSGDTLSQIAQNLGTDVDTLASLNKISDVNKIQAGATLNLPENKALSILGSEETGTSGISTSDEIRNAETKIKEDQAKTDQEKQTELARLQTESEIANLKKTISGGTEAPTAPNLLKTYEDLMKEDDDSGMSATDYQTKITGLQSEKEKAEADLRKFSSEEYTGTSQRLATGRVSEAERAVTERIDAINRQINTYSTQLTNRQNVISNIMTLTKEDYANTSADYDKKFSQNLQLYTSIDTKESKDVTNAKANLKIIQDQISDGSLNYDTLDTAMKAQISNLELQSGLPQGITSYISKNVEGKVLSTTSRTGSDGNEYFDVLTKGTDGSMKVTSIYKGTSASSTTKEEEAFDKDLKKWIEDLVDGGDWGTAYDSLAGVYKDAEITIKTQSGKSVNKKISEKLSKEEIKAIGGNPDIDETWLDVQLNKKKYYSDEK